MPNIEQGISNDEVKPLLLFPSAFVIRYSAVYPPELRRVYPPQAGCEEAVALRF
jgi:hypothetical protein